MSDEEAIQSACAAIEENWRAGNAKGIAATYHPNVLVINPFGMVMRGRAEAERVIGDFLAGPARGSTHKLTITGRHSVRPDVVVVDVEVTNDGITRPDGAVLPTQRNRGTLVFVKEAGSWLIADMRGYVLMEPPGGAR